MMAAHSDRRHAGKFCRKSPRATFQLCPAKNLIVDYAKEEAIAKFNMAGRVNIFAIFLNLIGEEQVRATPHKKKNGLNDHVT